MLITTSSNPLQEHLTPPPVRLVYIVATCVDILVGCAVGTANSRVIRSCARGCLLSAEEIIYMINTKVSGGGGAREQLKTAVNGERSQNIYVFV